MATCGSDGVFGACLCTHDATGGLDAAVPDAQDAPVPDGIDGCAPRSCADLRGGCGFHDDGCNGSLWCGDCSLSSAVTIDVAARDLLWDPVRGLLYVSTASSEAGRADSVVAYDPVTAEPVFDVHVGSEPGILAISDDASVLYVGLDSAHAVRRVELETRLAGAQLPLGVDGLMRPRHAGDMAVLPGRASTLVVSMRDDGGSFADLAVFDDGVPRPEVVDSTTPATSLELSNASTAYGFDARGLGYVRAFSIGPRGIHETRVERGLLEDAAIDIVYEGGLLFTAGGEVIDPIALRRLGAYAEAGEVVPDASTNITYVLTQRSATGLALIAFDRLRFGEIGRVTIRLAEDGTPSSLVRWGPSGFAFLVAPTVGAHAAEHVVIVTTNLAVGGP